MTVKFHKNAIKFIDKCTDNDKEKIRVKIKELFNYYNGTGVSNFQELKVKSLDGIWRGFKRIKIGKIRIIFQFEKVNQELMIYEIDYRGDIYK